MTSIINITFKGANGRKTPAKIMIHSSFKMEDINPLKKLKQKNYHRKQRRDEYKEIEKIQKT